MGVNLQALASGLAGVDPNEIVVNAPRQTQVIPAPEPDVIDRLARPQIVQPSYTPPPEDLTVDPAAVNPNSPELLDRRIQIFNAEEAQRKAAAQAAGLDYKPREQTSLEEFKAKPGLQFGTRGVARDIIGNVIDFFGSLVGRRPTYRKERFMDEIYGWDQPGQFEAAMNRGMQYDPEMTTAFMKSVSAVRNADANTAATTEYKKTQARQRMRDDLSGAAIGIYSAPDPNEAYKMGGRDELQAQLKALGSSLVLPEEYNQNVMSQLIYAGYGGGDIQRQAANTQTNMIRREIAANRDALERWKVGQNNSTRMAVARLQAETSRGNAAAARELRQIMADNDLIETGRKEDFVTGETTRTYNTSRGVREGLDVNNPPVGTRRRSRTTGRVETWDGNSWR